MGTKWKEQGREWGRAFWAEKVAGTEQTRSSMVSRVRKSQQERATLVMQDLDLSCSPTPPGASCRPELRATYLCRLPMCRPGALQDLLWDPLCSVLPGPQAAVAPDTTQLLLPVLMGRLSDSGVFCPLLAIIRSSGS